MRHLVAMLTSRGGILMTARIGCADEGNMAREAKAASDSLRLISTRYFRRPSVLMAGAMGRMVPTDHSRMSL